MARMECNNCNNIRTIQGRGLCKKCWSILEIRNKHGFGGTQRSYTRRNSGEDLTEEELDKIIQVQLQNLPNWWNKEKI